MKKVKTGNGWYGLLAGMGLLLVLGVAPVQAMQAEQPAPEVVPVATQAPEKQESHAEPGETELLHVQVGQPLEVSSPSPIKGISVSSPGIIDATLENSTQIRIDGKAPGGVSLVAQAENGQTQVFYIYVDPKDTGASAQLPEVLPENPAPAPPKKKSAWLGWAVIGSMLLVAGTLFKVLRQREPDELSLRSPALVPPDSCSEPKPSPLEMASRHAPLPPEPASLGATAPAENSERAGQERAEQWWQQFKMEAEAAMAGLREEIQISERALEESKHQLACLAEAKAASGREATQEDSSMDMALALQRHLNEMHQATAAEMESIKKAAGEAVAQLEAAEQERDATLAAQAGEAEKRLAGVSVALEAVEGRIRALVEGFEARIESSLQAVQGKVEKQAEDLEKLAQELGRQWPVEFQQHAEATVGKLREEADVARRAAEESQRQAAGTFEANLERLNQALASATAGLEAEQKKWVEECQRQLSSIVQSKVESISQFAVSITANLEAEHEQLKNEYETSRREFERLVSRRAPAVSYLPPRQEDRRKPRRLVPKLAMGTSIFLAVSVPVLAVYLWPAPAMQLQAQPPAEFVDDSPTWGAARRVREREIAKAYWQIAVANLQQKYPFGSELPVEPPAGFDVGKKYVPEAGAKAASETRDHYWRQLRKVWVQRDFWDESSASDGQWTSRLKHLWGQAR